MDDTPDTPPADEREDENPERQGPPDSGTGPTGAPEPGNEKQGPSGPPPESIPGDSGEAPEPER